MSSRSRLKIGCNKLNNGNKMKSNRGFTLTELLVGIVILMMMTMVISGGVNLALREYQRSVFVSESNVLNSSLQAALSDMLHYAKIVGQDGPEIYFTNDNYEINKGGYFFLESGKLFAYKDENKSKNEKVSVLNIGAYCDINVTNFQIAYSDVSHVFYGKYNLQSKNVSGLEREYYFVVQSLPEKLLAANQVTP